METKFDRALVELLERDQRVEWSKDRVRTSVYPVARV